MADSEASSTKEEKAKRAEEGRKEERGEGGKDVEGEGGRRQVAQRRNSQRAEKEEERRSRRALFQSVSTSNLNQQVTARNCWKPKHDHNENFPQPSSSLPPPLPRFHLGDLDQTALLPPKVVKIRQLGRYEGMIGVYCHIKPTSLQKGRGGSKTKF